MRKPLGFSWRTNSKLGPHLYWHSPHSLTWSWILRVQFVRPIRPSWSWHRNSVGFGGGIARWAYLSTYTTNGGRQFDAHLILIAVSWSRQQPMWFRDMYRRAMDRAEEAERQLRMMERFAGLRAEKRP